MAWIDGTLTQAPISWTHVEVDCTLKANGRELQDLVVTMKSVGADGKTYFDNLELLYDLTSAQINKGNYWPVDVSAASADFEIPAFGVPVDADITGCFVMFKTAVIGNNTDYFALKLINKANGNTICSKTFTGGVDAAAYEVVMFSTPGLDGRLSAYEGVSLKYERSGAGLDLPQCVVGIIWKLS